jgi:hypothetical protein
MKRTLCRTPNAKGTTNIPSWKFDALRPAILDAIGSAGPDGLKTADLKEAIRVRLPQETLENMGSLGWHMMSVKLELEVRGDIARMDAKGPQRLIVS